MMHQDDLIAEGESLEPPDEATEPPDWFPSEFKFPVLLFKPRFAGQSKVYSALENSTGHRVAIKQLKLSQSSDKRTIVSTIRELRFLRKLDHESIVNFLDVKMTPTHLHIVQELMDTDLDCVFDNFPDGLGAEHTHLFSYQLVRAANFLHAARVIHRDINPSNVFINVDTLMLKLGDFGSSRILDPRFGARTLSVPAQARFFHAPEILEQHGKYSFSADIFAIGCVLFMMVFGVSPICPEGSSPVETLKKWDDFYLNDLDARMAEIEHRNLRTLIKTALSRDPTQRPTAKNLLQSSYFDSLSDGSVEQQPVIKFSVEEEVFDFENLYAELCKAVKECKPDVEVHSGVKMNSSIRSFADYSASVATSTVSEHDARIAQMDFDFGIQIQDCSDKKDRMFYEDHTAECGVPFDPYKWNLPKSVTEGSNSVNGSTPGYGSDSGYQSDLAHWHPHPNVSQLLRCSESPDASSEAEEKGIFSSRNESISSFTSIVSERDLELTEEGLRHHFDPPSFQQRHHHHHHHHHHHRKHKHHKSRSGQIREHK